MENTRSRDTGGYGEKICEPCDDCYNLVQDATNTHRANLAALDQLLQQIAENPEPVGEDFEYDLRALQVSQIPNEWFVLMVYGGGLLAYFCQ